MHNLMTQNLMRSLWRTPKGYLFGKLRKYTNQRIRFLAPQGFPYSLLESKGFKPEQVVVNAIYTGNIWKSPGSYCMEFRDLLFEWTEDGRPRSWRIFPRRSTNKWFVLRFEILDVINGFRR